MHARFFQCSGARPTRAVRKQFEASEAGAEGPSPNQGDASATNQLIGRHRQRLSDRKVSPNRLICRRPLGEMSPNRTICRRRRDLFESQRHCRPEPAPPSSISGAARCCVPTGCLRRRCATWAAGPRSKECWPRSAPACIAGNALEYQSEYHYSRTYPATLISMSRSECRAGQRPTKGARRNVRFQRAPRLSNEELVGDP